MNRIRMLLLGLLIPIYSIGSLAAESASLYSWVDDPGAEALRVEQAGARLRHAIEHPEALLKGWIELPSSPQSKQKKNPATQLTRGNPVGPTLQSQHPKCRIRPYYPALSTASSLQ